MMCGIVEVMCEVICGNVEVCVRSCVGVCVR